MEQGYLLEDVVRSCTWLAHESYTELNALHPNYRPGRENYEWNAAHGIFFRIAYAEDHRSVATFVQKYADSRLSATA